MAEDSPQRPAPVAARPRARATPPAAPGAFPRFFRRSRP